MRGRGGWRPGLRTPAAGTATAGSPRVPQPQHAASQAAVGIAHLFGDGVQEFEAPVGEHGDEFGAVVAVEVDQSVVGHTTAPQGAIKRPSSQGSRKSGSRRRPAQSQADWAGVPPRRRRLPSAGLTGRPPDLVDHGRDQAWMANIT